MSGHPARDQERDEINQILDRMDERLGEIVGGEEPPAGENDILDNCIIELQERTAGRVADAIVERIIANRTPDADFMVQLLHAFAEERAPNLLGRIARDRKTPDVVRVEAHRLAGWDEIDEVNQRRRFLDTLADPVDTLVQVVARSVVAWLPNEERLIDVLRHLETLSSTQRATFIAQVEALPNDSKVWILHALLHLDYGDTQRPALDALERIGSALSIGALERFAGAAEEDELRARANTSAIRIRQEADPSRFGAEASLPPVGLVALGPIDEAGSQAVFVVRFVTPEACILFSALTSDMDGLQDAYALGPMPRVATEQILAQFQTEWGDLVEADLPAARGIILDALEINIEVELGIPPSYELCEPLIHDTFPPADDERVAIPELTDGSADKHANLMRNSEKLLINPFFETWAFEPLEIAAKLLLLAPDQEQMSKLPYQELIEAGLEDDMERVYQQRLRRQAWLLDRSGDVEDRDLAMAIAATLDKPNPAKLAQQGFWRGMVDRAVSDLREDLDEEPFA